VERIVAFEACFDALMHLVRLLDMRSHIVDMLTKITTINNIRVTYGLGQLQCEVTAEQGQERSAR
jgi:hypothetical protein